jgi:hypothetical protein
LLSQYWDVKKTKSNKDDNMETSLRAFPSLRSPHDQEARLRDGLAARLDVEKFLKKLDTQSGLSGAGVIYFDGLNVLKVRDFQPGCLRDPVNVIIRAVPRAQVSASQPTNAALEQQNGPMYSAALEATSAAVACGAAVLGWAVVISSGATAIPSAGATSVITVLAYSASVASSVQCATGVVRTIAAASGGDEGLAWLDSQAWYNHTTTALDLVSLTGAGAAAAGTIKTLKLLKAAGNTSVLQALKQMARHERKRLTEALIRSFHPGISNAAVKAFIRAGVYPARYSSVEVSHFLRIQLLDAVGATLTFSGSALSGTIRHPGRVKDLVFGISFPVRTL